MHPDTQPFLTSLFGHQQAGFITLTAARHQTGCRSPTPSRHISDKNATALLAAAEKLHQTNHLGWEAYVAVGLRRIPLGRWRRGGTAEVVSLPALFADLDTEPETGWLRLRDFPLAPSCVVASGRGLHVYFFLREPTCDLRLANQVLRGLADHLRGDKTAVAQSLRLPGTLNWKYDPPRLCHLLELHENRRYQMADFEAYNTPSLAANAYATARISHNTASTLVTEILTALFRSYGAFQRPHQDWLPALCPCGHQSDYPGKHFFFHPGSRVGHCFGRHGTLRLPELCEVLQISFPSIYGKV